MMELDIVIIGAGIIGLAIASELADNERSIMVVEKEDSFGRGITSRNSGVIHAGIYYPKDSLKARLCVEGNKEMYKIASKYHIPNKRIGKLIIAQKSGALDDLLEKAGSNGADIWLLDKRDIESIEPYISAEEAIYSPDTGIIDVHGLSRVYAALASNDGADIVYKTKVRGIEKIKGGYRLTTSKGESITARVIINASGLGSDRIAESAGIDIDDAGYRLHYCKGEYFSVAGGKNNLVDHLIYPLPENAGLGIHTTLDLNHRLRLGPNAYYTEREEDYSIDESRREEFFEAASGYLPFLQPEDLQPDSTGIRPKLQGPDEEFRDFVIKDEHRRGLPGLINLIGIESPGITASPAIAKYAARLVNRYM